MEFMELQDWTHYRMEVLYVGGSRWESQLVYTNTETRVSGVTWLGHVTCDAGKHDAAITAAREKFLIVKSIPAIAKVGNRV